QAGLELPDYDWTLADWRTDVKKLTRDGNGDGKIDVYGVTMPGGWTYNEPWIWTFGAKYIDVGLPDREIAYVHTNTAEFKNALQFLHDIRFVDGVSGGSFNNGTSAMMITGPWGISDSAPKMKAAGYEFDFAPMPIGPLGGRATRQSFDTWVIWSGSPHKKEAYRFVSYALSPAGECLFADRAMPARFSALKCFVHDRTPYHEEVFGRIMSSGEGWMQPTNVQYSDVGSVLNKYINDVLANRMAPQEAAEHMYVEGNAILSKLWPPEWQAEWKDSQSIPQAEADRIFAQDRQIRSFKH
ncbi:MAG TPA: extracellular solute-binding protein, partial [Limnochordia bacterium]|nr:extracellular solute-binding protein [Limnochordia bacterium]